MRYRAFMLAVLLLLTLSQTRLATAASAAALARESHTLVDFLVGQAPVCESPQDPDPFPIVVRTQPAPPVGQPCVCFGMGLGLELCALLGEQPLAPAPRPVEVAPPPRAER